MKTITAKKILYIKLGTEGKFQDDCIKRGLLKLDYRNVDHGQCIRSEWDKVRDSFTAKNDGNGDKGAAKRHVEQLKSFYTEDEKSMWIIFHLNKLWWCFAKEDITLNPDGTKTRELIGKWDDTDIEGNKLHTSLISGRILKTQGYRGTICEIKENERDYLIRKINCEPLDEVVRVESDLNELKKSLIPLINSLTWGDFETLIDLIFRQAGWQRVSTTGKTQKTLDLDLMMPITCLRAMVQIKSQSDLATFEKYREQFSNINGYEHFFYFVHTPRRNLVDYAAKHKSDKFRICLAEEISTLSIKSGLIEWIMEKTS